MPIGITHHEFK